MSKQERRKGECRAAWQGSQEPVAWQVFCNSSSEFDYMVFATLSDAQAESNIHEWSEPIPLYAAPVASADALDAKRYRWFRAHAGSQFYLGYDEDDPPEKLDAAIDAAIQGKRHD